MEEFFQCSFQASIIQSSNMTNICIYYEESGTEWVYVGTEYRDAWERPTTGIQLTIRNKLYKVSHTSPTSNPADQTVTYYLIRI
jgi:hypothetical protein